MGRTQLRAFCVFCGLFHPCSLKRHDFADDVDYAERKGRRGYFPKKGVAEAERARCPAKGGTSEAEHRVAISSLGKSTAYFRGEYPRQPRAKRAQSKEI